MRPWQITINMTTLRRFLGISLILVSAVTFSGCKHHYKGYYRHYWRLPSQASRSNTTNTIQNTTNVSRPSYQPDPFYAQQAAKREANLRAVQQQQTKNDMYNYQHGYTNKLPR